jgi:hypothetical protein
VISNVTKSSACFPSRFADSQKMSDSLPSTGKIRHEIKDSNPENWTIYSDVQRLLLDSFRQLFWEF